VDSAARPIGSTAEQNRIHDLRGAGLGELARRAAVGEKDVTEVLSRTVSSRKGISAVPAMKFNSSI
jgi:hypothetical protein